MEHELHGVDISKAFHRQFFNCIAHQAFVLFGVVILGVEHVKSLYRAEVKAEVTKDVDSLTNQYTLTLPSGSSGHIDVGFMLVLITFMLCCHRTPQQSWHRILRPPTRAPRRGALSWPSECKSCGARYYHSLSTRATMSFAHGDKAFVIAPSLDVARQVSLFNGVFPSSVADLASITPADKRTFGRLNGGHGPLIQFANLGKRTAAWKCLLLPSDRFQACTSDLHLENIIDADVITGIDEDALSSQPLLSENEVFVSSAPLVSGVAGDSPTAPFDKPDDVLLQVYASRVISSATELSGHTVVCGPGVGSRLRDLAGPLTSSPSSCVVAPTLLRVLLTMKLPPLRTLSSLLICFHAFCSTVVRHLGKT